MSRNWKPIYAQISMEPAIKFCKPNFCITVLREVMLPVISLIIETEELWKTKRMKIPKSFLLKFSSAGQMLPS